MNSPNRTAVPGRVVTRDDIARAAGGLSLSTVSFALSNHPRVAPKTRQHVADVARRLGYIPNSAARRLIRARFAKRTTELEQVALLFLTEPGRTLDPVCLTMLSGAEQELAKMRASLTFVRLAEAQDWEKVDRLVTTGGVDGWLVYGPATDETMSRLEASELPSVILGDHRCTQPVSSADVDNIAVGRMAAQYFASRGHRRVAYMAGSLRHAYTQQILTGFRSARHELGLDEDERLIIDFATWRGGPSSPGANHPIEWLKSHDPAPTAVFMPDYGVAMTLCPALEHSPDPMLRGLAVLSSGFDAPIEVGQHYPCINLKLGEVGRAGAALLQRIAADGRAESVRVAPGMFERTENTSPATALPTEQSSTN